VIPPYPPSNGFVPVPGCWICAALHRTARAAWYRHDGLTLRDWLSVTAGGMRHRMADHGLPARDGPEGAPDDGRADGRADGQGEM
jgi:hypothetical protein